MRNTNTGEGFSHINYECYRFYFLQFLSKGFQTFLSKLHVHVIAVGSLPSMNLTTGIMAIGEFAGILNYSFKVIRKSAK